MLRNIFITILFSSICIYGFSQQIKKYNAETVKIIKIGSKEGELGRDEDVLPWPPTAFTIAPTNEIYIIDSLNGRISKYSLSLTYLGEFTNGKRINDGMLFIGDSLLVDTSGNVYVSEHITGLTKIDKDGEKQYFVKREELPREVYDRHRFFYSNDYLVYNDDKGKIIMRDNNGNILDENAQKNALEGARSKFATQSTKATKTETEQLQAFITSEDMIPLNGKVYTGDFLKYKKYKSFIGKKVKSVSRMDKLPIDIEQFININFLSYDSDGNTYWSGKIGDERTATVIIVFSPTADLLDCFSYNFQWVPAVAPNGDVYFMDRKNKDGIGFYKITRRW